MFTDEVLRDMVGSGEVVAEIEREWEQLLRDRQALRQIFPKGGSKVIYRQLISTVVCNNFDSLRHPSFVILGLYMV